MNIKLHSPGKNDVLSSRGHARHLDRHPGNVLFNALVAKHKEEYGDAGTTGATKTTITNTVVEHFAKLNPPGRFLKESNGVWEEMSFENVRKKAQRALRAKDDDVSDEDLVAALPIPSTYKSETLSFLHMHRLALLGAFSIIISASTWATRRQEHVDSLIDRYAIIDVLIVSLMLRFGLMISRESYEYEGKEIIAALLGSALYSFFGSGGSAGLVSVFYA